MRAIMIESARSMRTFIIVWIGQLVSIIGTRISRFALAIWVWQQTGEATALVLVGVFSGIASTLGSLAAGPLVDRWSRQRVMIVSDLIAGACTLVVLLLYTGGQLQVWHLYVVSAVVGFVGSFQSLAYSASLVMMMPKEQYARANAMISLSQYASLIAAPFLGGLLLTLVGLVGVLLVDIVTFLFGVTAMLAVRIPQPEREASEKPQSLWRDSLSGFQYVFLRPGLLGLLLITFTFTLMESLGYPLIMPMILARTGSEVTLGTILAVQGLGGVIGGTVLTLWGGPKRRIHGVLIGLALTGLLGDLLMGMGQTLPVWVVAAFCLECFIPLAFSSYFAIWQTKVEPAMQGRVFAARDILSTLGEPLAMIFGGLLTDKVLEPAMQPGGALVPVFGGLVGTGPGAGMALLLVLAGVFTTLAGLGGYLLRPVREVETLLPDQIIETEPELASS
jgi:MFS transporter, DHA3 family, macrolide efflux protein